MSQANNTIMIVGRVGREPEVRRVGEHPVCRFSLAVDQPRKDKDGNKQTDWFDIELWGRQAEIAQDLIRKGSTVSVAGSHNSRKDRDGKVWWTVKADGFQLIGPKPERKDDDDIPAW